MNSIPDFGFVFVTCTATGGGRAFFSCTNFLAKFHLQFLGAVDRDEPTQCAHLRLTLCFSLGDNCAHHHWTAETWYGDVPFSPSIAGMFLVEANPPPTQPSTISMALEAQPTASATTAQCLGPSQQDMDCAGPNLDERTRDKNLKNQTREAGCSHSDTIKKRPVHLGADVRNPKRRKAVPQITGQQKISGFFAHALMTTL